MKRIVIRLLEYDFIPLMWNIHTRTIAEKHLVCSSVANILYCHACWPTEQSEVFNITNYFSWRSYKTPKHPLKLKFLLTYLPQICQCRVKSKQFAVASKHSTHVVKRMAPSTVATVALKWRKNIFQTFIWSDYFILCLSPFYNVWIVIWIPSCLNIVGFLNKLLTSRNNNKIKWL